MKKTTVGWAVDQKPIADYVSRILEAMAWEGWNPLADSLDELADNQQENLLRWIAENPDDPERSEKAAEWVRDEMLGKSASCHVAIAERLARALKSGTVRSDDKRSTVMQAVATFVRENRSWPSRAQIVVPNVSARTRDLVFLEIAETFQIKLDSREKWVDPQ